MYKGYFRLDTAPFGLATDTRFLYLSPGHSRVRASLEYALYKGDGLAVITGEIGAGKSTLIREFTERPRENIEVVVIWQPRPDPEGLLEGLLAGWDHEVPGGNRRQLVEAVRAALANRFGWGIRTVILIDEAQVLSRESLEELRLLADLEIDNRKPLSVMLVGQPCLAANLASPDMEQFRQRVRVSYHLSTMDQDQTRAYIRQRLAVAGAGTRTLFADDAIPMIHRYTGGVPRLINVLCDLALTGAYLADAPRAGREQVAEAVRELGWPPYSRRRRRLALPVAGSSRGVSLAATHTKLAQLLAGGALEARGVGAKAARLAGRGIQSVDRWRKHRASPALRQGAGRAGALAGRAAARARTDAVRLQRLIARNLRPPSRDTLQPARGVAMGLFAALAFGTALSWIRAPSTTAMRMSVADGPSMRPAGGVAGELSAGTASAPLVDAPGPLLSAIAEVRALGAKPAATARGPEPLRVTGLAPPARPPAQSLATDAVDAPAVAVAGAASAPVTAMPGLDGADWLLAQPSDRFVIQILATNQREVLDRFLSDSARDMELAYYRRLRNDQEWHVLVTGMYPSLGTAREASIVLPDEVRVTRPWVRPLASVQADIRNSMLRLESLAAL